MSDSAELSRLLLMFRRASSLPLLPQTAMSLVRAIDEGEASAAELEQIIISDASLAASFLRVAAADSISSTGSASTIRSAIMMLGQRTVRTLATSLIVRELVAQGDLPPSFEAIRFASHSLAVAFIARYLFARKHRMGTLTSDWSADEVFATGLLHDLGIALLARVAPEHYSRVHAFARRRGASINEAFAAIFGCETSELSASAAEAWQLPELFSIALRYQFKPWEYEKEFSALCCINYANYLAESFDMNLGDWPVAAAPQPEVAFEFDIPDGERAQLKEALQKYLDVHCPIPEADGAQAA